MPEEIKFNLSNDESSKQIVAALLTNAVINRLGKKSTTTSGALEKVAEIYNTILGAHDDLADWKKLGE